MTVKLGCTIVAGGLLLGLSGCGGSNGGTVQYTATPVINKGTQTTTQNPQNQNISPTRNSTQNTSKPNNTQNTAKPTSSTTSNTKPTTTQSSTTKPTTTIQNTATNKPTTNNNSKPNTAKPVVAQPTNLATPTNNKPNTGTGTVAQLSNNTAIGNTSNNTKPNTPTKPTTSNNLNQSITFGGQGTNVQLKPITTPMATPIVKIDLIPTNKTPTIPTTNTPTKPTTPDVSFTATSATTFVASTKVDPKTDDSKALNITQVVRPTGDIAKEIQEVVKYTNQLRTEKNLKPLIYDANLSAFAQMRASEYEIAILRANGDKELRRQLAHQRPDGRKYSEGVQGYGATGENLAYGYITGKEVVLEGWKNSQGHYKNIMTEEYERIGVGLIHIPNSPNDYYWVQIFGSDSITYPYEFNDSNTDHNRVLTQILVDGRTIPVSTPKQGEWQAINTNNHQGFVNGYQHSRFGVVTPNGAEPHVFYQGNQTADYNIPKSGTASYRGTALVIDKDGNTNTNLQSAFTANFDTRKLGGSLTQNSTTLYKLSADINGSGFASQANAEVQTQGAFFGQNAQELAGVFKDTKNNAHGAFGAKNNQ